MEQHIISILERLVQLDAPYMWNINEEERFYDLQTESKLALDKLKEKGVAKRGDKL